MVQDLRDIGVKIWNEWELEDGTIGKAYGYQLGKKTEKQLTYTDTWRMELSNIKKLIKSITFFISLKIILLHVDTSQRSGIQMI
ncbi:thymidylate synthase [Bacillus licheniformis]|uniref:thymidylate synthase n=1 Tax=Bacillus licheniformis TaxID=1402 RepID=UPI003BF685EF